MKKAPCGGQSVRAYHPVLKGSHKVLEISRTAGVSPRQAGNATYKPSLALMHAKSAPIESTRKV